MDTLTHSDDGRIPVALLTGFLGAGKTTLLNFLLRHPAMTGTAVVINEYGAVGLDHHLIEQAEPDDIELIEGGCICCTANGRLGEALLALLAKARQRQIPDIRRIIIETTGLAEPGPILQQLQRVPDLHERFVLDGVVTLVDCANAAATLDEIDIAQQQITAADRLLLTKTDLVPAEALAQLEALLAAMNPDAVVERLLKGAAQPAQLFAGQRRRATGFRIGHWLGGADRLRLEPPAAPAPLLSEDTRRPAPLDLQTFSVIVDEPLPAWRFFGWLDFLRSLCGADLLRVKGIIHLEGEAGPSVIHGVQNCFHPVETLPAWPSEDRRTRIVFIARGWGEATVRHTLAFLHDSAPSAKADQRADPLPSARLE